MNKIELPTDLKLAKQYIDTSAKHREIELNAGLLGKLFGSNENVRLYIIGFITIFILLISIVYTFIPESWRSTNFTIGSMWGIISPILTTIIGYLIGSNKNN
jgi:uncharacterized membrane protein HdeD (DUF308 family)